MPLLRAATLERLVALQAERAAKLAMLTIVRDDPQGFGRVVRDDAGRILGVVEEPEATPAQLAIRELNAGIYMFEAEFLWEALPHIEPSAEKGEYYLTDMVALASAAGHTVVGMPVVDAAEVIGVNTRVEFALAEAALRERVNTRWMLAGVTLRDPATTYIGPRVTIGQDTVIEPNTHLRGATSIGEDCVIGPNTLIDTCTIGDRCAVRASVLEHATLEDACDIGPFGHLRKGARMCQGAHMGNFGEMKNSTLGPGAKMGHFSYLGDAQVAAGVNIGAGTITCNYDGARKHPTTIEEGAFIGSGTMIVAPRHIGAGANIGAGSVVTHDVPAGAVAYGVPARVRAQREKQDTDAKA
jgi:bifunctional UDP-N-acetylglucosamine pyrophosphorylase/glucosamine-1-phosphate N-acetyltransferase